MRTGKRCYAKAVVVDIANGVKGCDVVGGYRLNPHGLPDARNRCVPYTFGLRLLLANGLIAVGSWVEHTYGYVLLLLGIVYVWRNVEAERGVASAVRTNAYVVDVDIGLPVDSTKMKQDAVRLPVGRDVERAAIP